MARSTCIYGGTGCWKTAQIKGLARYTARTTGKATLLLSADGGGWAPCQPEIDAGMIRPYRVETATLPLVILRKISQGYWPADPNETEPSRINLVPINYDEIGAMAIEGWTSISQVVLRYLPDKGINVGGEDRWKLGGFRQQVHVNGAIAEESFASSTRGDYGFILNNIYGLTMNANSLRLQDVLWTALEAKTEDDDRSTTFGPAIAGKKATAQCGSWVGNLIHAQDFATTRTENVPAPGGKPGETVPQSVIDMTVRFYFKKHLDPSTGVPFPAKPRVTPEQMAALDKRFPGGYFEPKADGTNGLDTYLTVIDELAAGQADTLKGWREKADARLGRNKVAVAAAAVPAATVSSK
jgi:hypothetical protein